MGDVLLNSFLAIFEFQNLLFIILGVFLGFIFGSLPGLTATMGVALMLPVTYALEPTTAMLFLLGIYCAGTYGGSASAILINTPGTPASAATVIDGYALAEQGKASVALRMALLASVVGGIFSALALLLIAPQLSKVALEFGPPEFFALALFGLTMIISVSSNNLRKGVIMGILGILISTIGLDPIGGLPRFSFGNNYLMGGINLIPALIGLFAISEIIKKSQTAHINKKDQISNVEKTVTSFKTLIRRFKKTMLKSSAIGTFIGAIPGTGPAIAAFLSYNEARRASKNKDEFGKGSLDGIAASEAGNNGVTGATLIPLLTLGIPGDTVTAVMLGALMMQGLAPGPELFVNYADVMYTIMFGLILVNIFMFIQGTFATKVFAKIKLVPINLLLPILIILCFIGSFAVNNTMFDVKVMLVFGLIGFILPKFGFPITPMLLGIVLGPIAETSFRQSLAISDGSYMIFLTKPIALVFILIAVISILLPIIKPYFSKIRKQK
ncbi:C4-dicarboxylate ABC transporter permease [Virgibacillus dakarensis]|uniref:C4-dicarboxylate ABC transporter permease n=1 Tax=Lentibacillus populi TaxID=1827502 RepID=A0A9W5TV75_9BACI|nr:tripartite tricarboxylate transporter permease [Lentibacillus populi]MTW87202.1 C4-dicarboxylate ABC transporter permease [Virgibacillus dakarensis]GGB31918.1 C4-dicarboxylate ABC transporter permease [Lentibacillus populi]